MQHISWLQKTSYALVALATLVFGYAIYRDAVLDQSDNLSRHVALAVSVSIPEVIIWIIAAAGAWHFKRYAHGVRQSADGHAYDYIAAALLVMVVYVVLESMSGAIAGLFRNTSYVRPVVLVVNYLPLTIALISTGLFLKGAMELNRLTPLWPRWWRLAGMSAVILAFYGLFLWAFYTNLPHLKPMYGVPHFVLGRSTLLLVYVLPYMLLWTAGLIGCLLVDNYANHVSGSLYRSRLQALRIGVLMVYIAIYLTQFLVISSINLIHVTVTLVFVYLLLVLAAIGFILIYRGASRLQRLEEV